MTEPTPPGGAWAIGVATLTPEGRVLDTWYPAPVLATGESVRELAAGVGSDVPVPGTARLDADGVSRLSDLDLTAACGADAMRGVEVVAVATFIEGLDDPPVDAHDVYLRLHLLSHRLVAPHGADLTDVFALLSNVVWTTAGPCPVEGFERRRAAMRAAGTPVQVLGVDKFPRMTDYVLPEGVRIADADRVRLGAHLASGTTVMHEGFVNFNGGTLGPSMVEGRISQGVVVGSGSDLGGGSSIMGTLSGGGKEVIRVGERCLIGANAGIGISLGDDCTVEAGLYVTAGTRVTLPDGTVTKALELSGHSGLLFRRNSTSGSVEVLPRRSDGVGLSVDLHSNYSLDCPVSSHGSSTSLRDQSTGDRRDRGSPGRDNGSVAAAADSGSVSTTVGAGPSSVGSPEPGRIPAAAPVATMTRGSGPGGRGAGAVPGGADPVTAPPG